MSDLQRLAQEWEKAARAQADWMHDQRGSFESDEDSAWSGFENLRSMLEYPVVPDIVAQCAEAAYRERCAKLYGKDYFHPWRGL